MKFKNRDFYIVLVLSLRKPNSSLTFYFWILRRIQDDYALLEYTAVRIYPQCIRYHPQNGIPVLLPASYIPSRRIAFDD